MIYETIYNVLGQPSRKASMLGAAGTFPYSEAVIESQ